jgi:rhodanese-related sulfurtransferase
MLKSISDLVADAAAHVGNISPDEAFAAHKSGEAMLIDVREPLEWEPHIEGAVQVPRGLIEFVADPVCGPRLPPSLQVGLDPTRRVILYCNSGVRAILAAYTLKSMGYERVENLAGGFDAWKAAGLPVAESYAGLK